MEIFFPIINKKENKQEYLYAEIEEFYYREEEKEEKDEASCVILQIT